MIQIPENLSTTIANISMEIEAIKHSFQSTTERNRDSFQPFLILFSDADTKSFAVKSRPIKDVQDYYTAISEMMFAYGAMDSKALLFAIDVNKIVDDEPQDLLEIYAACEDYCTIFSMPYYFDEDNNFHWNESLFNVYTLERLEKAYDTSGQFHATLEIFELLYFHTHMDMQYFDNIKMKSFFDFNNFTYVQLSDDKSDSIKITT